jgi:putative membrane protein
MNQNNPNPFHLPQRQSLQAIWVVAAFALAKWVRNFFPLILLALVRFEQKSLLWMIPLALSILLIALLGSYLWYVNYTYAIQGEKLIIKKGVFSKEKVDIPFERIQNVAFKQNVLQQLLKVTGLTVETAGSRQSEASLIAIPMEKALKLRQALMQGRVQQSNSEEAPVERKKLLVLSPQQLLKIGLSANHLGSAILLFFLGLSFAERIGELLGFNVYDNLSQVLLSLSLSILLFILPAILLLAILYSLVRTYLRYFQLEVKEDDHHLLVSHGLTKKQEKSLIPSKIQIIEWHSNWVREKLGFGEMNFRQASAEQNRSQERIALPGCTLMQRQDILDELGMGDLKHKTGQFLRVDPSYYTRGLLLKGGALILTSIAVIGLLSNFYYAFLLAFPLSMVWFFGWKTYYKNLQYCVKEKYFTKTSGVYDVSQIYFYWHKIQGLKLYSSPFMRRKNLVNIVFYTAGGSVSLPYIRKEEAHAIVNKVLFHVSSSKISWM